LNELVTLLTRIVYGNGQLSHCEFAQILMVERLVGSEASGRMCSKTTPAEKKRNLQFASSRSLIYSKPAVTTRSPGRSSVTRGDGNTGRYALFALARNSFTPASGAAPTILATTLPFLKASCEIVASARSRRTELWSGMAAERDATSGRSGKRSGNLPQSGAP
jgi:hypothetical protein